MVNTHTHSQIFVSHSQHILSAVQRSVGGKAVHLVTQKESCFSASITTKTQTKKLRNMKNHPVALPTSIQKGLYHFCSSSLVKSTHETMKNMKCVRGRRWESKRYNLIACPDAGEFRGICIHCYHLQDEG